MGDIGDSLSRTSIPTSPGEKGEDHLYCLPVLLPW